MSTYVQAFEAMDIAKHARQSRDPRTERRTTTNKRIRKIQLSKREDLSKPKSLYSQSSSLSSAFLESLGLLGA
jgi:hypothetical protein